ncbi:hypothetical protein J4N45_18865 [Vibrio sp. SCSIO 43140]|nr:hypothetical protein J4N45_18865 [Vibrio sp. SCSIO 43140]
MTKTRSRLECRKSVNIISLIAVSLIFTYALLFAQVAKAADDYAIFSMNESFKELSRSKARMLYRGKTKSLQGKRVELSDWPENSAERATFYQSLLGKDVAQMNAYWASLSFSGKARPPKEIRSASIDDLIQWLSQKPERIGYAPLSVLPDDANVLYVVEGGK